MFERRKKWSRWAAPRSELLAAVQLAAEEMERWDDVPARASVRIVFRHGLSQESNDPQVIGEIHPTDLRRIRSLWVDLRPDFRAVLKQRDERILKRVQLESAGRLEEAEALKEAERSEPASSVSFRVEREGLELRVEGENRTDVDGLTNGASDVLIRSASWPTRFPAEIGSIWLFVFGVIAALAGAPLAVLIEGGHSGHRTHRLAAFLAWGVCILVGVGLGAILWWAFPAPEILDEGQHSRFRRARVFVVSSVVAVVLSIIGAVIYAIFQ